MKDDNYVKYWNSVWKNKIKFNSIYETNNLPWDIKSVDNNLISALEFLNLTNGNLLELGCGSGYDSNYLGQNGFNVTAIDISDEAIKIAKKTNLHHNVEFLNEDFFSFTSDKLFDVVYDRGFLHNHQDKLDLIFKKLYQTLNDYGVVILITGNPNQNYSNYCRPTPIFLKDIEINSFNWFKIILVQEIIFKLDKSYGDGLGYLFILQKRKHYSV